MASILAVSVATVRAAVLRRSVLLEKTRLPLRHVHTAATFGIPGMPTPVWDMPGQPAIKSSPVGGPRLQSLKSGMLHKVVWMCWTGSNPLPPHLRLCMQTVERNSGLSVILVTPGNVADFVPDPHPGYQFLHLAHRADYLRCYLLHHYGGIYLDADTICLRSLAGLFDLLDQGYDCVGYDGSQWGELVGISDMGPFRPFTEITSMWFNALHGKMQQHLGDLQSQQQYAFYWQEILRDIFVPISIKNQQRVSTALLAHNPEQEVLWSVSPCRDLLARELDESHIFILNNSKYGHELSPLTEEQIVGGPAVLSQVLRRALGLPEPQF